MSRCYLLEQADRDPEVRVIVVTGAGKGFRTLLLNSFLILVTWVSAFKWWLRRWADRYWATESFS